jgi:hypothetical protein
LRRWSRTAGPQASAGSCVASGRVALRRRRPSAGRGCLKYAARDCAVRAWAVAGAHGCLCMLPRLRGASTPSISDSDLEMSASGRSFSELFMVPTFRSMVASGICRTACECAARRAVRPVRHGWAQGKEFPAHHNCAAAKRASTTRITVLYRCRHVGLRKLREWRRDLVRGERLLQRW